MTKKIRPLLILIVAWMVLAFPSAAGDWPMWSGPNRDLTSLGNGVFAGSFALERRWSKPLGPGYSGISVVGERLVTGFSDGRSDVLVALDAGTGEELWRYRIAPTYRGHDLSEDGPLTTPTIDHGVVYGLGPRGHLFALRLADGREIWSRHLVKELGAREPIYGFHSTPTIIGGVLVVETGGANGHSITGLEPATGELLWSTGDDMVGYQSPMALRIDGQDQIVAVTEQHLLGLTPRTGDVLWQREHRFGPQEGGGISQPVPVSDATLLLTEWYEAVLFRVAKTAGGFRAEEVWRSRALGNTCSVPVPYRGYLYGYSGRFLTCVGAETGRTVWKSRQPGEGNLVLVDGHLVIRTLRGEVVVAEAVPEGYREKARIRAMEKGHVSKPSFAAGRIQVRNHREIAVIGVTAAPVAGAEIPGAELRGEFGKLVRKILAAADPQPLVDELMAAHRDFPLLEGDDLVHFVYRGKTEDLGLTGNMLALDDELPMHRIPGTDFHFRSLTLEPGASFEYAFVVFDERIPDPLNPRTSASSGQPRSVVTTRGWQEPAHLREPQGPRGRREKLTWQSALLGGEREVEVYLPPGYDDGDQRYPLLVVHRGDEALAWGRMDRSLDNLVGRSVAPLVVAFVPSRHPSELGSRASEYAQALVAELVPRLEKAYRTRPDRRATMGVDRAAWLSFRIAFDHPGVFGAVAAQSFWLRPHDDLFEVIARSEKRDLRLYVEWSRHDLKRESRYFEPLDARADSQRLVAVLEEKGYRPVTHEVADGFGWGGWRQHTDRLLETLFPLGEAQALGMGGGVPEID